MKRIIFSILFIALFFCSCNDEDNATVVTHPVTFNVVAENGLATKSGDVSRFILAIYDLEGKPQNVFEGTNQFEQSSGVFNVNLDASREYQCVFWADYGEVGASDNFYNTSDMKAVSMNKNGESAEAFSGVVVTSTTKNVYEITLKHSVARIDYIATDDVGADNTMTVSYSVGYTSLNALDGSVTEDPAGDERAFQLTEATGLLVSDYIFAPKGSALMDITMKMANAQPNEVKNVPHQVNYKTNIRGDYMTGVAFFEVTADDQWWDIYVGETKKTTYFPTSGWRVDPGNDYQDPNSQFNVYRMLETPNLVAFWEPEFGDDPENCSDPAYRFPLRDLMEQGEKMFRFFRDDLKFAQLGNSVSDDYRMVLYFFYSDEGTVYGGSADGKVGAMWITPNRVKNAPYGAIAHEMGHAFQEIVKFDMGRNFPGGSIFEMTSQYMLWQYYSNWIVFENYHLVDFMKKNHNAFLHETNMYHSPFVLEYWASLHGNDVIGKLWRSVEGTNDILMTYKLYAGLEQAEFNDELHQGYMRFMTWDMDRIREVSAPYINQHVTKLEAVEDDWYRIAKENCPQDYGYNGIALAVPDAGTEILVDFKGIAGADGYNSYNLDKAGWRYGVMALTDTGKRVYSRTYSEAEGQVAFTVPEGTVNLWLVVMGAPTEHAKLNSNRLNEWPYQIKLTGTTLAD